MKNLKTLIKLQKTKVDEQRILLMKLQEQLEKIIEEIKRLDTEKDEQKRLLDEDPSFGITYDQYLKRYLKNREGLLKKKASTEYAVGLARDKLSELFEEQKRYEIALQHRIEEEEQIERHRQTVFLDEVASVGFVRRKKKK